MREKRVEAMEEARLVFSPSLKPLHHHEKFHGGRKRKGVPAYVIPAAMVALSVAIFGFALKRAIEKHGLERNDFVQDDDVRSDDAVFRYFNSSDPSVLRFTKLTDVFMAPWKKIQVSFDALTFRSFFLLLIFSCS
jgi:hypothetical protein